MKKRIFFIWSLLLITIGSFGSSKVYQQVITEQFRNEIAGIALNDSFPSADRFGNLYPGTVAQNIINVLNTDPSGVQLTKSEREYVITIVSGLRPVWGKMKAVYGFVGGNEWKHKWNWKDMRDLDEAFRLLWNGDFSHSSNGVQSLSISSFADKNLITSNVFSQSVGRSSGFYANTANTNVVAVLSGALIGNESPNRTFQLLDRPSAKSMLFGNRSTSYGVNTGGSIYGAGVFSLISNTSGSITINNNTVNQSSSSSASVMLLSTDMSEILFSRRSNNSLSSDQSTAWNGVLCTYFDSLPLTVGESLIVSSIIYVAQGILNRQ